MKKQRLGEKDYSRLLRTEGESGMKEERPKSRSRKRKRTTLEQRGIPQSDRERVLRRWSKTSRQGRKREFNLTRKGVNGGKLRRDRGVTRSEVGKETGRYSRRAVETGKSREALHQFVERTEGNPSVKRRGIGRKGEGKVRKWMGHVDEAKMVGETKEEDRESRRSALKGVNTTEHRRVDLKKVYRIARRKGWRGQRVGRSSVRVAQEAKKKMDNHRECSTVGSAFALHARGHEFESRHFQGRRKETEEDDEEDSKR